VQNNMQTSEKDWDLEALTREFLATAQSAERYLSEVRAKLHLTKSYEPIYDQTLADLYVFNYLHDRTFLATRESLLSALHELVASDVPRPANVFDFNLFLTFRKNIAQSLIQRFQHKQ